MIHLDTHPSMTLSEATWLVREARDEGVICPCCEQQVKEYRRSIHSSMVSGLLKVHREFHMDYGYVSDLLTHRENADFAKLAYWGLIEPQPGERADGSTRTGWWRVTRRGYAWIHERTVESKYAIVYNKDVIRFEGERLTMEQAIDGMFDYRDILG